MANMRQMLWATREFGRARLGDQRRTRRLIEMAATTAAAPAGQVTQLFTTGATREAAYRFLENPAVDAAELGRAAHLATANRCYEHDFVFVPVDATSLSLR